MTTPDTPPSTPSTPFSSSGGPGLSLPIKAIGAAALLALVGTAIYTVKKAPLAQAPVTAGTVVATINGKPVTEADLKFAEAEIGSELGQLPELTKRRVLVEYLVDTQLYADAAAADRLAEGPGYEARIAYWKRRALRDVYFDQKVTAAVSDAEAKKFYDAQVAQIKPQEEVRARHILVDGKDKAVEIADKIAKGGDFAALAKEFSKDPGSKETGGDLGFFAKGQMVPQFEEAAFTMKAGEVSKPIETQFGWHVLKVEEKRSKPLPTFDQVKERIVASLVNRKTQEATTALRAAGKVDYIDTSIKKMVEDEKAAAAAKPAMPAPAAPAAAPAAPVSAAGPAPAPAAGAAPALAPAPAAGAAPALDPAKKP